MLVDKIETAKSLPSTQEDISDAKDEIIEPDDALSKISEADLFMVGKIWIELVKTGLLGTKSKITSIIPKVEAAPPPVPQKPPKMKYKDLPVYSAPHYEYKDHLEDSIKRSCPLAKKKLIHDYLLPHVSSFRKNIQQTKTDFCDECRSMKKEASCALNTKKNKFIRYMRDDENLVLRQAVLALGGITGFYIGSKKTQVTPRIFLSGVGLLAAGSLCFPNETDETFRALAYTTGKFFISFYNKFCGKGFALKERLPCQRDIPPPLGSRKANVCPKKK